MTNIVTDAITNAIPAMATELSPQAITAINGLAANQVPIVVLGAVILAILIFKG